MKCGAIIASTIAPPNIKSTRRPHRGLRGATHPLSAARPAATRRPVLPVAPVKATVASPRNVAGPGGSNHHVAEAPTAKSAAARTYHLGSSRFTSLGRRAAAVLQNSRIPSRVTDAAVTTTEGACALFGSRYDTI